MPKTEFKVTTYERLTNLAIQRLQTIKTAVLNIQSSQDPPSAVQLKTLSSYASEVKKKCADFDLNLQRVLESAEDDDLKDVDFSTHQDTVCDLQAEILSTIEVLAPQQTPSSPSVASGIGSIPTPISHVRLPKLDLQKFSGDLSNWVSFINLFDTTIHENESLSAVVKFQYLISVLSGEPLALIKSLSLTTPNYHIAYELLRERYHSPRRLTTLHLNQLLDLPNINASSIKGLRNFVNLFTEHSQALKALGCDVVDTANPLLSALLLRKMDNVLCKKLEHSRANDTTSHTLPDVKEIIRFLNTECTQVEDVSLHTMPGHSKVTGYVPHTHSKVQTPKMTSLVTTQDTSRHTSPAHNKTFPCFCCNQSGHKIYSCTAFKNKTPQERLTLARQQSRCVSCLGGHSLKECQSQVTCQKCHKRHHTLLHFKDSAKQISTPGKASEFSTKTYHSKSKPDTPQHQVSTETCSATTVTMTSQDNPPLTSDCSTVLLGTLLVKLKTPEGNCHVFRALLDSGSMCDLITERAAQLLNTRRYKSNVQLSGLCQTATSNNGLLYVDIETLSGTVLAPRQSMVILDTLTVNLPRTPLSAEVLKRTQRYVLADPTFHLPGPVDVVLGGAIFPQILTHDHFSLGQHMPHVVGTLFGYVVMGSAPCTSDSRNSPNISMLTTSDVDLHSSLQRFWQQEEPPTCKKKSAEEELCDQHFESTHSRNSDGRYIVRLPFKEEQPSLGSSLPTAERRLHSLERKLAAESKFSVMYHNFMDDYISLGHMTKTQVDLTSPHYFLPHHGVINENSSTTKLRTVFDASCKTSTGVSLNDTLLTGRKLQTNICDILLHFRSYNIVFACDIRQMYRQIHVHPDDRQFQLILWRDSPTEPLSTYQLNTVTYGMNSSPFLAIKTLHQLADDEGDSFPAAAQVLKTQTYIDDIICGADTEDSALELQDQLVNLLRRGGFELRKWISNSPSLLQSIPEGHLETPVFLQTSEQPLFSILGLHWSPTTDCFTYSLNLPLDAKPTKRSVLSLIAKIYDPCGFLAPFIMLAKCFMQFLWTTGLTWDEPLQPEHCEKWQSFVRDAQYVATISIPRPFNFSISCTIELHGFADASESGYAAIVYYRCQLPNQDVKVCPVISKTRVAPLKRVTLPRLELCAAHLLAQLVSHCQTLFKDKIKIDNICLWSDSSVVLTWLRTPPYRLKTYVANRVSQTQELVSTESWRHISTSDNPADCASRGISASQLVEHSLWWTGPPWLKLPHCDWPKSSFTTVDLKSSDELKQTPLTVLTTTEQEEWSILSKFSSWEKLQRVMAIILRFVNNCRSKERRQGLLSLAELTSAREKIFLLVQQSAFSDDILQLKKHQNCSARLQRLKPFIGADGLLRVGGRLGLTALSQDIQHPVLLPKSHKVVDLVVDYYHVSNLHAGPQLTQALLAKHVWILCARSVIRSRIFKCLTCFKNRPKNQAPLMGELPVSRVTPARPFLSTGVDYAGPFTAKIVNLRSSRQIKVYLCVFVCMVTKAVHIEVVTDLTTDAFIAALTRLVSRRGLCSDIYSDCGTNFIGADAKLRHIVNSSIHSDNAKENIQRFTTAKGIRFHFNPPAAPHQGGLWESAVKSAKHHLRRVMGNAVLTLPELTTLTTQIEAMLNSRPLTPLSSDPSDLHALTPGHFLIGAPLAAVPETDFLTIPSNRLKHWHLIQAFHQRLWKRWQLEYLHNLQQRSKWNTPTENLRVGQLVLIHQSSPPLTWPLGRIIRISPGSDGVVRVVQLQTQQGVLTRPAIKVFPLPIHTD